MSGDTAELTICQRHSSRYTRTRQSAQWECFLRRGLSPLTNLHRADRPIRYAIPAPTKATRVSPFSTASDVVGKILRPNATQRRREIDVPEKSRLACDAIDRRGVQIPIRQRVPESDMDCQHRLRQRPEFRTALSRVCSFRRIPTPVRSPGTAGTSVW